MIKVVKCLEKKFNLWILGLVMATIILSTQHANNVQAQSLEDYVGPEICKDCHPVNFNEWEESKHSQAFQDPEFQEEWGASGNPKECLECHTTGFDSSQGEYAYEGVTCEACHGAGLEMKVDETSELCGSCHTGEFGHNKFEEFKEGIHYNSGVTCANCHIYEDSHTFEIESKACASCHTNEEIHSTSLIEDLQIRAREAENQITLVEEEHENLLQQIQEIENRTSLVTQITYLGAGAIVLVAIIIILLFMKQKKANTQ
jgi:hypothetical protein